MKNGDLKSAWKTINTVLNKKSKTAQIAARDVNWSLINHSKRIAGSMNTFSCSIGNTLIGIV